MSTILITGGAGFIGSHTADALVKDGHKVRVLDLLDPQIHGQACGFPTHINPSVECLAGDVRNPQHFTAALADVDAVYHFAALTGVGQSMYELRSYVETNCTGTATLLEAIVRRGRPIKRLILASSRAVYGEGTHLCSACGTIYPLSRRREDLEQGRFDLQCPSCGGVLRAVPTKEDRPLRPLSIYAWSKKQQEEQCQFVAQTFNVPVTCLRYFNVYGSRQSLKNPYTGIVAIFFSRLMANRPISLYEHGTSGRDFVHISDVVRANVRALEAEVEPGTCINVGTGTECTIADVANAIAIACSRRPNLQDHGEFRVGDIRSCYADLSRARALLGYEPKVQLGEGMAEFVAWAQGEDPIDRYEQTVTELRSHGLFGNART